MRSISACCLEMQNLSYTDLIDLKVYGEIILFRYENRIPLFALQRGQKKM